MASNPIFAILWLALLWFIAWPVAGLCAAIWIILQVMSSFFVCLFVAHQQEMTHIKSFCDLEVFVAFFIVN
jgi:hypothetical protein